jgi:predicted Ser/Thr protein kinase|nr:serine/threonine-protein kinase [uncultured Acetatifactor sp.]
MEYEEIRLLKQSDKSTVHLVREKGGSRVLVRKKLAGRHPVYQTLQKNPHPGLPRLYEVAIAEDSTTVIEEYIEGQTSGEAELSGKQFRQVVRELCAVLEFLHGKGIIHRDIKPSNILLTEECHVRLIDFDAARMPREGAEQDTRLLGTRGFAPPEQYGFAQTDERADIYALGVTMEQLLGETVRKPRYRRVIRKCRNLNPDKRYQSMRQVRQAFFPGGRRGMWAAAALILAAIAGLGAAGRSTLRQGADRESDGGAELTVLPAPGNPHWDGETGTALWDNVPGAGAGDEAWFQMRVYRKDTADAPDVDEEGWYYEDSIRFGGIARNREVIDWNITPWLEENGYYYFTVSATGDGVRYADSPFVVSDVFEYTGESAPPLAAPTGLAWRTYEIDNSKRYFAVWDNLDDYEDNDVFNVAVYDQTGAYVLNNTWSKRMIEEDGHDGIYIEAGYLIPGPNKKYRFTVQVYSARPNEYSSSPMPDPAPEEYYSPWLVYYGSKE